MYDNFAERRSYQYSQESVKWMKMWGIRLPFVLALAFLINLCLSLVTDPPQLDFELYWMLSFYVLATSYLLCMFGIGAYFGTKVRITAKYEFRESILEMKLGETSLGAQIDLRDVKAITIGRTKFDQRLIVKIKIGFCRVAIIQTLGDMNEFIAELEKRTPIQINKVNAELSPWPMIYRVGGLAIIIVTVCRVIVGLV